MRPCCLIAHRKHTLKITQCDVSYYDYCQIQNGFEVFYSIIFWIPCLFYFICTFYLPFFRYSLRTLPFGTSFLHLPHCFYLCSPILLFFVSHARQATIVYLCTLYTHRVFVWIAFWPRNILYYLPTFFTNRYLIWTHLLSKNAYIAESKTNDLMNNNGVSLSENVNWYNKAWKQFGSFNLGIKLLFSTLDEKPYVAVLTNNALFTFIPNVSVISDSCFFLTNKHTSFHFE